MAGTKNSLLLTFYLLIGAGLLLYSLYIAYLTAPLTATPRAGHRMNLQIFLIAPSAIVGGLFIAAGLNRADFRPSGLLKRAMFPIVPVVAVILPIIYLAYAPTYYVGPSTQVWILVAALAGLLVEVLSLVVTRARDAFSGEELASNNR